MHPILFELPTPFGPQPVYAYGLLLSLSILLGWQLTLRLSRRDGLPDESVSNACLLGALAGLLGGRLLYVAVNPALLEESGTRWYHVTSGGSMLFGGLAAGAIAVAVYAKIKALALPVLADATAPGLALGAVLTRIGCYLYGCDFGKPLPEGAPDWLKRLGTFPRWSGEHGLHGSPALFHHQDRFMVEQGAPASLPVHPTQLYEAAFALALLGLVFALRARRAFTGQVIATLGMAYAAGRYLLEQLRDEPDRGELLGFTASQFGAIALFVACGLTYAARKSSQV